MNRYTHAVGSFFRRNATTIPLVVIALSMVGIFGLQAVTIGSLDAQVRQQNQILEETKYLALKINSDASERAKQTDDINRHLDCIVQFFAQSDRNNKSIEDIDACRIETDPAAVAPTAGGSTHTPQSSSPAVMAPRQPQEDPPVPPPAPTPPESPPPPPPEPSEDNGLLDWLLNVIGIRRI